MLISRAEPVKPPWKSLLMFARMARLLLANTTVNFAVIRPMLFCCVKVKLVYTMGPHEATLWSQLARGTLEKATKLFDPSDCLMSMYGNG